MTLVREEFGGGAECEKATVLSISRNKWEEGRGER